MIRVYASTHLDADDSDEISAKLGKDEKHVNIYLGTSTLHLDLVVFGKFVSVLNSVRLPSRKEK